MAANTPLYNIMEEVQTKRVEDYEKKIYTIHMHYVRVLHVLQLKSLYSKLEILKKALADVNLNTPSDMLINRTYKDYVKVFSNEIYITETDIKNTLDILNRPIR